MNCSRSRARTVLVWTGGNRCALWSIKPAWTLLFSTSLFLPSSRRIVRAPTHHFIFCHQLKLMKIGTFPSVVQLRPLSYNDVDPMPLLTLIGMSQVSPLATCKRFSLHAHDCFFVSLDTIASHRRHVGCSTWFNMNVHQLKTTPVELSSIE